MNDERVPIAEIAKNKREVLRIELGKYKGKPLLNARIWFKAEDGTMRPSRDGWAVNPERIDELIVAFTKARTEAERLGWFSEKAAA